MRNTFTDPAHVLVDRGDTTQIILQVSLILPQGHVMVIEIFWGILLEIDVRQVVGNPSWSPYAQESHAPSNHPRRWRAPESDRSTCPYGADAVSMDDAGPYAKSAGTMAYHHPARQATTAHGRSTRRSHILRPTHRHSSYGTMGRCMCPDRRTPPSNRILSDREHRHAPYVICRRTPLHTPNHVTTRRMWAAWHRLVCRAWSHH